jgi:hypothetical protein
MLRAGKDAHITLSISPFIPKAWTPFQWQPFENVRTIRQRLRTIVQGLRKTPHTRVVFDLPKWGYIQSLLSMGDRRVGDILALVLERRGDWSEALKNVSVNPDFWVYRRKKKEDIFPWDFIDFSVDKNSLWTLYTETTGTVA